MARFFCALLALAIVLTANLCCAAVFERDWKTPGDGLLTYDDVNRREWLDLSVSALSQFPDPRLENAIAEISPGGLFDGFAWARRVDVVALAQSAGIDTASFSFSLNQAATNEVIDLLGVTFQSSTTIRSIGFIEGTPPFPQIRVGADFFLTFIPSTGAGGGAGLGLAADNDVPFALTNGLMLYRNVPEPASLALLAVGIAATFLRFAGRGA